MVPCDNATNETTLCDTGTTGTTGDREIQSKSRTSPLQQNKAHLLYEQYSTKLGAHTRTSQRCASYSNTVWLWALSLCYLGSHLISSYEMSGEHKAGYPEWMVKEGLSILNQTRARKFSAQQQVIVKCQQHWSPASAKWHGFGLALAAAQTHDCKVRKKVCLLMQEDASEFLLAWLDAAHECHLAVLHKNAGPKRVVSIHARHIYAAEET